MNTIIKPSKIHGLGLFSDCKIFKGQEVFQPDKIDLNRNIDGWICFIRKTKRKSFALENGYCMINHSNNPNTIRGDEFSIIAIRDILQQEEITENYNNLPDNENPFLNKVEKEIWMFFNSA